MINQVRGDFEEMGIDDNILNELQRVRIYLSFICLTDQSNGLYRNLQSWETKVARSRVANFMVEEGYYDGDPSKHAGIITEPNQLQYPPVTIHEV